MAVSDYKLLITDQRFTAENSVGVFIVFIFELIKNSRVRGTGPSSGDVGRMLRSP